LFSNVIQIQFFTILHHILNTACILPPAERGSVVLHHAAELLHESKLLACIENDGHTPWLDFNGGSFSSKQIGDALRSRFLDTASDEAASALLAKIMKSSTNIFPQFYTQDQCWKVSKSFGPLFHSLILTIWNNWRERMPSLIDEAFTLACTGIIAHLVHLAKFEKVDEIVQILNGLKESDHASYTKRTAVFQAAGTCLLYLDATEQHREVRVVFLGISDFKIDPIAIIQHLYRLLFKHKQR
jgi:hypothetical protein